MKQILIRKNIVRTFIVLMSLELSLWVCAFCYNVFTDRKLTAIKTEGSVYKIICIGESTVAGHGATDYFLGYENITQSFPAQLEKIINSEYANRHARVYNLGVVAVSQEQIYKRIKLILNKFEPDMVVFLSGENCTSPTPVSFGLGSGKAAVNLNSLKLVKLVSLIRYKIKWELFKNKRSGETDLLVDNNWGIPYHIYSTAVCRRNNLNKSVGMNYVEKTLRIIKNAGYKIVVCNYFTSWANSDIKKITGKLNLILCDNEKIFIEYSKNNNKNDLLCPDGWHPNDKGYKMIARNIYNCMIENSLIQ